MPLTFVSTVGKAHPVSLEVFYGEVDELELCLLSEFYGGLTSYEVGTYPLEQTTYGTFGQGSRTPDFLVCSTEFDQRPKLHRDRSSFSMIIFSDHGILDSK